MRRIEPTPAAPTDAAGQGAPQPVATIAEAERLLLDLMDVMEALLELVEHETTLIRAGRTNTAALLEQSKSDLARHYVAAIGRLQSSHAYLCRAVPDAVAALQRRHDMFRALLQINLTVLAATRAVADGIIAREADARAAEASPERWALRRLPPARWPMPIVHPSMRAAASHAEFATLPFPLARDRSAAS
jgi:hypothetical protein